MKTSTSYTRIAMLRSGTSYSIAQETHYYPFGMLERSGNPLFTGRRSPLSSTLEKLYLALKRIPINIILLLVFLINTSVSGYPLNVSYNYAGNLDSCNVDKLRTTLMEFLNKENTNIYEDEFLLTLKTNNTGSRTCYFPGSNDIGMFWSFIEKNLVIDSANDKRALGLLVDLTHAYKDNAELSAELFTQAINKVAIQCLECYINELSIRSIQEMDFIIHKLEYLNSEQAYLIQHQLNKIKEPKYQSVVDKIGLIINN